MDIGGKLKTIRLQCALTQEELADRCELTKGYISQLENDVTSPSIETLRVILSALGTDLKGFFTEEDARKVVFTEQDFVEKLTEETSFTWLVPDSQKNRMEPALVCLKPGTATARRLPYDGEEFGYVLKGTATVCIGGKTYAAPEGSAFYFLCDQIHRVENRTARELRFLWISSPPNF